MDTSVIFSPHVSMNIWLTLAAISTGLAGYSVWKGIRGVWVRSACMAAGLILLANPVLRQEDREDIPDIALLVIDQSESMTIAQRDSMAQQVGEDIKRKLAGMPGLELRILNAVTKEGDDGTSLFTAAQEVLSGIPVSRRAGVIFVTDGQIHDVPREDALTEAFSPLHVLLTGDRNAYDRRLRIIEAPRYAIVGEPVQIRYRISEKGPAPQSGPVTLSLSINGKHTTTTTALPGETGTLSFTLPHGGVNVIEVEVPGLPGELTLQNNRTLSIATGIRDRLRVLLVSGEPHAGERAWRNLLKADPAVDLVHFTILRPPEKQDGTPINELSLIAFPTRELFDEKLQEFDLVIFDRYKRRGVLPLAYLDNITRYIKNGGAVLTAAGPSFASPYSLYRTPLSAVLPAHPVGEIIEEPYYPVLSDQGMRHPITADLPGADRETPDWGRWFRLISTIPQRGEILMNGPSGKPLVVVDRVGEGRIAQLLSDHAWLWARGFEGGGPQTELFRRLAHWLMKEPDLEEEKLSAYTAKNRLLISRRSMSDTIGEARIVYPDGNRKTLRLEEDSPGHFSASIETALQGLYQIEQDGLTAVTALGPPDPREFSEILTTDQVLDKTVQKTGGGLFWLDDRTRRLPGVRRTRPDRDAAGKGWLGLRQNQNYTLKSIAEAPLFPPEFAITLFLLLMLAMWRRESG